MFRIKSRYDDETDTVLITVVLHINDQIIETGTKTLDADINDDESISFGENRSHYSSGELTHFINDIKNNIPSVFMFDKTDDYAFDTMDNYTFDGFIFGKNQFKIITCNGKLSTKITITFDDTKNIVIDLLSLQKVINSYCEKKINDYRLYNVEQDHSDDV